MIMKTLAILCNMALFAFTALVLAVDGPPAGAPFVVLMLLALLVPLCSSIVLMRSSGGAIARMAMVIGSLALLVLAAWAIAGRFPRLQEKGTVAYALLLVLTPLLGLVALLKAKRGAARP
jgi:hypothetical protein